MKNQTLIRLNAAVAASLCAAAFFLGAVRAHAQANANPPPLMTYQGFLVDVNGVALGTNAPKNYDVIFRIWDAATGGATPLWAEQQTVTVDKGYFSVLLGEGSSIGEPRPALSALFTNATASDRWIGLTVKSIGAGGSDANILPRLRLLTAPYSFLAHKAVSVDGAALTTGTVADARLSANVALRAGGNTFTGNQIFGSGDLFMDNSRILAARNSSGAYENVFWPRWSDNVTYLNFGAGGFNIRNNGSQSRMFLTAAGNVGIGTITPTTTLEIVSSGTWRSLSVRGNGGTDMLVAGTLSGRATIGGHNAAANTWTDLSLNPGGGNVGIGTSTPGFPLNFPNSLGDKISLWGNSGNHFGFGIQGSLLQIHSDISASDIAFGHGSSAAMTERMRIKGTGNVGIGISAPESILHVGSYGVPDRHITVSTAGGNLYRAGVRLRHFNANHGWTIESNEQVNSLNFINHVNSAAGVTQMVLPNGDPRIRLRHANGSYGDFGRNFGGVGSNGGVFVQLNNSHHSSGNRFALFDGDSNWDFGSDRKLKKDIVDAEPMLDRAMQVQVRRYRWKDDAVESKHMLGVVAQELQPLFPDLVGEFEDPASKEKCLTVGYSDFGMIAVKALQEFKQQHDAEVAQLKSKLAQLTRENEELQAANKKHDDRLAAIEKQLQRQNQLQASHVRDSN